MSQFLVVVEVAGAAGEVLQTEDAQTATAGTTTGVLVAKATAMECIDTS